MKKWLWVLLLFQITNLQAQIKEVVKWDYKINKIADNEYEAVLKAQIDEG